MKLELQVVSLKLSKHLKELGVKQESLFWWQNYRAINAPWELNDKCDSDMPDGFQCSAFTVAELGEMLPARISLKNDRFTVEFQTIKFPNKWVSGYWMVEGLTWQFAKEADTEANARAEVLIYLLENKLIN